MSDYQTKVHKHKVDSVDAIKERLGGASDYVFADYRGLSVDQITELRKQLREKGSDFRVIKNRYAKLAFEQMELPDVSEYLIGPTAIALAQRDAAPATLKTILDFSKEAAVDVKGALVEGDVFTAEQAQRLSKLPPRDELLAKLMSAMNGPAQNMVFALNAVPSKLVRTLKAVEDKKREEEGG
ncbi:MAG: 50S ribosomal protein L10 [Spirochaetes bacterium]|jgi:large subunit ribosomal protein L10|nr:50S ribosomal protein L10 [Spirochaetota bacterium]